MRKMQDWYEEIEEKARDVIQELKTVEEINRYLIDNVEEVAYEDEESVHSTAYGALVLGTANCEGFAEAMIELLENLGEKPRKVKFAGTKTLYGVAVGEKLYSPFVQKVCERRNDLDFASWMSSHKCE